MTLTQVIDELCAVTKNFFCDSADKVVGTFTIENGTLNIDNIVSDGQYYRLSGTIHSDGVHRHPEIFEYDETFNGAIQPMKIHPAFIRDAETIMTWRNKYGESVYSPYSSESFEGYSYSMSDKASDWRSQFGSVVSRWRKIR